MNMRASLVIAAKDQASRPIGTITSSVQRMGQAFRPVQTQARAADRAIDHVGQGAAARFKTVRTATERMRDAFPALGYAADAAARPIVRLGNAIGRTTSGAASRFAAVGRGALRMARDMNIAERAAYGLGVAIGTTIRKTAGVAWTGAKIGLGATAAATGYFLGGIIPTASKFEQFEAQLEGTEGSAKKAASAMNWVAKFAAQTPYEIDEVTDAFVRARGVGIDPMTGAMTRMGDAAAANRKTIMDTVEAIADAQTGEFERLKAFNITTSVKGDSVSFSFLDKAGKNAVRTTKKNAADIQRTILSIWDDRHGGAMIRQSQTFDGIWRNLIDWVTLFQLKIANTGGKNSFFNAMKNDLANLLDTANRFSDDGTLDRWAGIVSENLRSAWNWGSRLVSDTDWKGAGSDVREIAKASWIVATAFGRAVTYVVEAAATWSRWRRDVEKQNLNSVINGWFTSDRERQNARARLDEIKGEENAASGQRSAGKVAPIVGSGGRATAFSPAMQRRLDEAARNQRVGTGPRRRGTAPARIPGWQDNWNQTVQPGRRMPATSSLTPAAQPVQVGGRVSIEVKAAPGTEVRTSGLQTANRNVPISVRTGRTMAGPA